MKKNFIIFISILILIPTYIASLLFKEDVSFTTKVEAITGVINTKKAEPILVKISKNNEVMEIDLEEYVVGVVAGEMPASFELEALKAQAVTSRTYALFKKNENLNITTDDQAYITIDEMKEKWNSDFNFYYDKVKRAVTETKNIVMKKNKKVFKAFYFAMSNGYTEDSLTVFKEEGINGVESHWDNESINKFKVSTTFTENELISLLNINSIKDITITSRDKTNRVEKLIVNDRSYTGIEFRKLLNLRSTDFTIEKEGNKYIITTKGYGHGVGMSQYGANGMAKENYKYEEILKHYYNDIKIEEI